jgi:hypothetical protein
MGKYLEYPDDQVAKVVETAIEVIGQAIDVKVNGWGALWQVTKKDLKVVFDTLASKEAIHDVGCLFTGVDTKSLITTHGSYAFIGSMVKALKKSTPDELVAEATKV